ncbi:MAG: InlB B-repeat-containing protein [Bacilli bacterium]
MKTLKTEFTLDTIPAEDVTLYAKWEINQYTISFESDGGVEVASITQEYGTNVVPPQNPERVGFTFAGWYTEPEFKNQYIFGTMPA